MAEQRRRLLECPNNDKLCVVRENQTELIVVPVLLVGVFVVVLSIILWLHYLSWRTKRQTSQDCDVKGSEKEKIQENPSISEHTAIQLNETTMDCLLKTAALTLRELALPREKISLESMTFLQNGSFGVIYRAELENASCPGRTQSVILKALPDSAGSHEMKHFLERIQFHQFLGPHENIIQLLGCCINQMPLYMVLEDASNGNLLNFLWTCRRLGPPAAFLWRYHPSDRSDTLFTGALVPLHSFLILHVLEDVVTMDGLPFDLTERQVYKIGKQITSALDFLQQKKLFHGDVAARNVLIGHDFTAKLCRLGLAYKSHTHSPSSILPAVPVKWQAPEQLLKKAPSIKSDIWSFGILLYEMITLGAPPFPEVPPTDMLQHLQRQHIMKRPASCQQTMYGIMKCCWCWVPTDRPSPTELLGLLQAAVKSSNDQAVLQVPELVVPELYAAVAGTDLAELVDYTVF